MPTNDSVETVIIKILKNYRPKGATQFRVELETIIEMR